MKRPWSKKKFEKFVEANPTFPRKLLQVLVYGGTYINTSALQNLKNDVLFAGSKRR